MTGRDDVWVWSYRQSRGPDDAVAPCSGSYWLIDLFDLDLVGRVWVNVESGLWVYDVTEANEVEYGGTPCLRDEAASLDQARAAVENYAVLARTAP